MAFSWPGVESKGECLAIGLGNCCHRDAFGDVLADEAVEVFVAASFPGVIGGSKVAVQGESLFQNLVVMELSAVVEGDCPEVGFVC